MTRRTLPILALAALLLAPPAGLLAGESPAEKLKELLSGITSEDDSARMAARLTADEVGAPAVVPLGDLLDHENPNVKVAARATLESLVHHTGRPGGGEERGDVCAELVKLIGPDRPEYTRREALHLLAFIAGDRSVAAVARQLADPSKRVREAARLALERIPGKSSIRALAAALERVDPDRKGDFLYSLSKKKDPDVVPLVAAHAGKESDPGVRYRALEALARLGAVEAIPLLDAALKEPAGMNRERLLVETLRLADYLRATVDPEKARPLYRRVLAGARADYLREHALHGACPPGASENLDLLVASLGDPSRRVRRLATGRLNGLESGEVSSALRNAFRSASRTARPAILLALAGRDRKGIDDLLEEAASSADPALRVAALEIRGSLGHPELESDYLELAEKGPEIIRPIAVKGYLALARGWLDGGEAGKAFSSYTRALDLTAASPAQRGEAIRGLVATGRAGGLEVIRRFLQDSTVANDAARGVIELAGKVGASDRETAAGHLMAVVHGRFPREIIESAVARLRELGVDPQAELRARGFVLRWWLTTPIRNEDGQGFERPYFPEVRLEKNEEMGFRDVHTIGTRRIRWRRLDALSRDGAIDLAALSRRSQNVLAYAYVDLVTEEDRDVLFRIGSDDGVACFLNGKRIHAASAARSLQIDQDTVRARLARGKNRVLLKITQSGGDWAFSFRITDGEGNPLDTAKLVR